MVINATVAVYRPKIRIPVIKGGMTIPNYGFAYFANG